MQIKTLAADKTANCANWQDRDEAGAVAVLSWPAHSD
jgi:hypothetical protein